MLRHNLFTIRLFGSASVRKFTVSSSPRKSPPNFLEISGSVPPITRFITPSRG